MSSNNNIAKHSTSISYVLILVAVNFLVFSSSLLGKIRASANQPHASFHAGLGPKSAILIYPFRNFSVRSRSKDACGVTCHAIQ